MQQWAAGLGAPGHCWSGLSLAQSGVGFGGCAGPLVGWRASHRDSGGCMVLGSWLQGVWWVNFFVRSWVHEHGGFSSCLGQESSGSCPAMDLPMAGLQLLMTLCLATPGEGH